MSLSYICETYSFDRELTFMMPVVDLFDPHVSYINIWASLSLTDLFLNKYSSEITR